MCGCGEAGVGGSSLSTWVAAGHGGQARVVSSTQSATSEFSFPGPSREILTSVDRNTAPASTDERSCPDNARF